MSPQPQVQPLPYQHRTWFFRGLAALFFVLVPMFIFYATGYRVSLFNESASITTVGGMFITAEIEDADIYVNDQPVKDYRIFQRAAYIQNVQSGMHTVHVQADGVYTWIKELPVFAHIVTEAYSFNLPSMPHVRVVAPYVTSTGTALLIGEVGMLPASGTVAYSNLWTATSTKATSTLLQNQEYEFLSNRFASSTATSSVASPQTEAVLQRLPLVFATSTQASTTVATTTKTARDYVLYERDGSLFVTWTGSFENTPHYFCVQYDGATTTATLYGQHVIDSLAEQYEEKGYDLIEGTRACRDTIRIDTKHEKVLAFDFYPSNNDLIIMHRSDGIFVVETDDRAWQNTQQLYPKGDYAFIIEGSRFFIEEEGYIFELLTQLP